MTIDYHPFHLPLTSGTRLRPYELNAPLGAGGMGEVYRARDTRLDRAVAIKVLPTAIAADPVLGQRLEREARAMSALDHPHICSDGKERGHGRRSGAAPHRATLRTDNHLFYYGCAAGYEVGTDGSRFLVNRLTRAPESGPIHLILNWQRP